jgi:superfamily I DNA/RNA helicase
MGCDGDDYVAHRTLLGTLPQVGAATCHRIADQTLNAAIRYRDIFYIPLPAHFLTGRALVAVNRVRAICAQLTGWTAGDTLAQRNGDLINMLGQTFGATGSTQWVNFSAHLPPDITLEELRNYVWADNDEQQAKILERVYERLTLQPPAAGFLPQRVRLMTMHGAKGLGATVVFIPGLEESILPGNFRQPYPGLVLEAARLLYVSVTRARAGCILSYADQRLVYGRVARQHPSHFLAQTGGAFTLRQNGLANPEVSAIITARNNMI